MAVFSIDEVVQATGASLLTPGGLGVAVDTYVVDSRAVSPGALFVAMAGERVNGNDYASDAIRAGAVCVCLTGAATDELVRLATEHGCALLRASDDDGEEFLLRLAGAWRNENPQWRVVGVTGSVGKTTTKDMLAAALGVSKRVHATVGNLNSLVGMPLTLLATPATTEVVVAEMGMNAPGEIARLSLCARPDIAVITNVGTSHIGMLGSREAIAYAKAEIVCGMSAATDVPTLVLNGVDEYASLIAEEVAKPAYVDVLRVGVPDGAAWADEVTVDDAGRASFLMHLDDGSERRVHLGVPGRPMATNALVAVAVAGLLDVDRLAAAAAIESMPAAHMRLELLTPPGGPRVIDDTYNASPSSMAAALDVLAAMSCEGRRVAVLGEMGELGDEAERLHGYVGAYAAAISPDLLVLVGDALARSMADAARVMGLPSDQIRLFDTVEAATEALASVLDANDVMLAKGSRAACLDRLVRGVTSHAG